MKFLKIDNKNSNSRLDKYLYRLYPGVPKSLFFKLIRKGVIKVNRKKTSPQYLLQTNDEVKVPEISLSPQPEKNISQQIHLKTLYRDDDLIIIDKPVGIAVQGGTKQKFNVIDQAEHQFNLKIYPVHRLDKETSGCLIFALNYNAARDISEQFSQNIIKKKYYAVTVGVPSWQTITIDRPIIQKNRTGIDTLSAITKCRKISQSQEYSLLQVEPLTGRKHQIRIHLSQLGFPILGDVKYSKTKVTDIERMYLHASMIAFSHPSTRQKMSFVAASPKSFSALFENH
ncbi:MAG: hypothetical protein CMF42_02125 [Legionellales bacterium]|nr:hypothetical protein [Legionellales bacterium]|tara:strand:+ start:1210 stop:2064 length:855 start_codon:yes stop_codon:yes gene_type:complete